MGNQYHDSHELLDQEDSEYRSCVCCSRLCTPVSWDIYFWSQILGYPLG